MATPIQTAIEDIKFLEDKAKEHGNVVAALAYNLSGAVLESLLQQERKMVQKFFECGRNFQLTGENNFNEMFNLYKQSK
jgi:hypothetical protein